MLKHYKKYVNRRLYDMEFKEYATLAQMERDILAGADIEVLDHKTGEDVTRRELFEILREKELRSPSLTVAALLDLIRKPQ